MLPARRPAAAVPALLAAAALAAVAAAWRWGPLPPLPPAAVWGWGLALLGAAAACHRPLGEADLAAGAAVLPALAAGWGPAAAGAAAAGVLLLSDAARFAVLRRLALPSPPPSPGPWVTATSRAALAAVAGAFAAAAAANAAAPLLAPAVAGAVGFGAASALLDLGGHAAAARGRDAAEGGRRWPPPREWIGHAVAAAAWGLGATLLALPPAPRFVVLAALALLALEAARQAVARRTAEQRAGELGRVQGAGRRMASGLPEIEGVVAHLRDECADLVPFHGFHLELRGDGAPGRSWWAGREGPLVPGAPRPGAHPPPRPGIHRRGAWRILDHPLAWGERPVARLRLWCDPRELGGADLELLAALCPQMAASLRQALLDREAREDPLTGVAVRRVLETRLVTAFREAAEAGTPLAVVMCDVDRFKRINDTHGHAAGDRALVAVAGALAEHKRGDDLLARYGGEEFTLLLAETDGATALAVAERLRRAVAALDLEEDGARLALTLSAGVAAFPETHVKTPAELLLLADGALYEAKRGGRDRCLLDVGGGRYRAPGGELVTAATPRPAPQAPRIFA